jgi:hypothetical protein
MTTLAKLKILLIGILSRIQSLNTISSKPSEKLSKKIFLPYKKELASPDKT